MKYNLSNVSVTALGVSAFDRIGLESIISHYNILAINNSEWVSYFPELRSSVHFVNQLDPNFSLPGKKTTQKALAHINWDKIKKQINIEYLLTYRPTLNQTTFESKTGITILNNSISLHENLENKAKFRRFVTSTIPLPKYELVSLSSLSSKSYAEMKQKWGDFVIQDVKLSAGRGTFFIYSKENYHDALQSLSEIRSNNIVVSQYIEGRSASVQVCATQYGVFSLPPQMQIINQSPLANTSSSTSDMFNGGQWSKTDFSNKERQQIKMIAQRLGNRIRSTGYKGIFGIDFIITSFGEIYCIEVNARLTGMTPIITSIQKSLGQIPFILLHTLEHLDVEYSLCKKDIKEINKYTWGNTDYGYLILFNNSSKQLKIKKDLKPGIYAIKNDKLIFKKLAYMPQDITGSNSFLLIDFPNQERIVDPDRRLGRIIMKKRVIDKEGNLTKELEHIVTIIRDTL